MKTLITKAFSPAAKKFLLLLTFLCCTISFNSCDDDLSLTDAEVIEGLKEALIVGTKNTVAQTNQLDGFLGNDLIKILWPQDAIGAYNFITQNAILSYLRPLVEQVIELMNRGAETAAEKATPIFIDAITSMTIADGWEILKGEMNAATTYLHDNTYNSLFEAFMPDIYDALESVGAASIWKNITTPYNAFVNSIANVFNLNPINTDLAAYTTEKALDGLFLLIEIEEEKIRTDPTARINDILQRVFGYLD